MWILPPPLSVWVTVSNLCCVLQVCTCERCCVNHVYTELKQSLLCVGVKWVKVSWFTTSCCRQVDCVTAESAAQQPVCLSPPALLHWDVRWAAGAPAPPTTQIQRTSVLNMPVSDLCWISVGLLLLHRVLICEWRTTPYCGVLCFCWGSACDGGPPAERHDTVQPWEEDSDSFKLLFSAKL